MPSSRREEESRPLNLIHTLYRSSTLSRVPVPLLRVYNQSLPLKHNRPTPHLLVIKHTPDFSTIYVSCNIERSHLCLEKHRLRIK
jgi:hypothetical protein